MIIEEQICELQIISHGLSCFMVHYALDDEVMHIRLTRPLVNFAQGPTTHSPVSKASDTPADLN